MALGSWKVDTQAAAAGTVGLKCCQHTTPKLSSIEAQEQQQQQQNDPPHERWKRRPKTASMPVEATAAPSAEKQRERCDNEQPR